MKTFTAQEVIDLITANICFDAIKQGWCENHGGKCSDLLDLIKKVGA